MLLLQFLPFLVELLIARPSSSLSGLLPSMVLDILEEVGMKCESSCWRLIDFPAGLVDEAALVGSSGDHTIK